MNQKDISGYEGLYAVTDDGRVWSYKSKKFLAITTDDKGYSRVELWKNGKRRKYRLHRLVAEAFIPNPDNLSDVAHLDESRDNCHLNNLCWMTHKDNCNMPKFKERKSQAMKEYMKDPKHREHVSNKMKEYMSNPENRKKVGHKVAQPIYCVELNRVFESQKAAAKELGLYQSNISNCCNGKIKTTGGYHWRFATETDIAAHKLKTSLDELANAVKMDLHLERIGEACNSLLESAC